MKKKTGEEKIINGIASAKASIEMEEFSISMDQEALVRLRILDAISHQEFLTRAKKIAFSDRRIMDTTVNNDVLQNKANIKKVEVLKLYESTLTLLRLTELYIHSIRGRFNFNHFKKIHEYIFQDIYPFAGKIREVNISKGNFLFARVDLIPQEGNRIFSKLKEEQLLTKLEYEEFIQRLAYFMSEINVLHPFRDGNGRALREFIRRLCSHSGYELDWNRVNKTEFRHAVIKSIYDPTMLEKELTKAIIQA